MCLKSEAPLNSKTPKIFNCLEGTDLKAFTISQGYSRPNSTGPKGNYGNLLYYRNKLVGTKTKVELYLRDIG